MQRCFLGHVSLPRTGDRTQERELAGQALVSLSYFPAPLSHISEQVCEKRVKVVPIIMGIGWAWWCAPVIPAFRRQRKEGQSRFVDSLGCKAAK